MSIDHINNIKTGAHKYGLWRGEERVTYNEEEQLEHDGERLE